MTKLLYFSGTGNTLWSAKKIAEKAGDCELVNIGTEAEKKNPVIEADAIVLLFPAYAYGAPLIVSDFMKRVQLRTQYFAAFVTYGTSPGGALAEIRRIVRRKKINAAWFGRIPAVENYIAMFGPQNQKTIERRMEMQRLATEEAVRRIADRQTNSVLEFRPVSAFVSKLFSLGAKIFYKWYKVTAGCDGCGICAKVCPVSAVKIKDSRPVFTGKCEHCQGCIHWCPKRAILFARVRSGTQRYHHPEISVTEMYE